MTELERFKAVCHFEKPDYIPIFGFHGAPGMSHGAMRKTHERLIAGGMPDWVDGSWSLETGGTSETWQRYWGTTGPLGPDFYPADPGGPGIACERRLEGDREIIEYDTGALTSQVLENDVTYAMPQFIRYHIRDRASWELYRDKTAPGPRWSAERIEEACRRFDGRDRPLCIGVGSTWGTVRSLAGTEYAATMLYDDPGLMHEIIEHFRWCNETYLFPLVERLRPEIVATGEDCCYRSGMLISPRHFQEFCAPTYRAIGQLARDCNADMVAIDTDGNAMELVPLVEACGVNAIYPFEVKAGNDLFALRERHPRFLLMGWLEKECVNEGNGPMIEPEIMGKVPRLLEHGGYFPNGDHGLQPPVTFGNLCRFMTLLHEVTGNPEGEFPRVWA